MADFLFEIGVEEFPPSFIEPAAEYLKTKFKSKMDEMRIPAEKFETYYTASRIALIGLNFQEMQSDLKEKVVGPPKKIALDSEGALSKAGQAFMKKNNLSEYFFEQGGFSDGHSRRSDSCYQRRKRKSNKDFTRFA